MFKLVKKSNHNALYGLFNTIECAEHHLKKKITLYIVCGYFMDKTLTPDCFEIINGDLGEDDELE